MYVFIFIALYLQIFFLISFIEGRFGKKSPRQNLRNRSRFPSVTIVVPCWNEERTVASTLRSLLSLDYPKEKLSLVVVDDGSTDGTLSIARRFEKYTNVRVYSKENGGKHTAVNFALEKSSSEFFGCLDADSFVEPDALKKIISNFEDPSVMAVTPAIQVKNPRTLVQRAQKIEYIMGLFMRSALSFLNAIQVTPGPFSIFRKRVFEELGPYKRAHGTEDLEIALRMHKNRYRIINAPDAHVFTVSPHTIRALLKQRLRWSQGFLENALDYREMFFRKTYGNFGIFTLPITFLFVFFTLYATGMAIFSLFRDFLEKIERVRTIGITPINFSLDWFYLNTQALFFVAIALFCLFILSIYFGHALARHRSLHIGDLLLFIVLYPFIVPIFLARAVWNTSLSKKAEWR